MKKNGGILSKFEPWREKTGK